ncbi:MAG: hypothetical protein RLO52_06165 [Sandaracinaceae bacterium]
MSEPKSQANGLSTRVAQASAAVVAVGALLLTFDVTAQEQRGWGWLILVAGVLGLLVAGVMRGAEDAATVKAPLVADAPKGKAATWLGVAFGVGVLVQAVIPLRYYFGDDAYDERFAWRMFSNVRVYRCDLGAFETRDGYERPVNLMETIHVGWGSLLRRNREPVMDAWLEWRCEQEGVSAARLLNRCVSPAGERAPDVRRAIDCERGEITEGGEE